MLSDATTTAGTIFPIDSVMGDLAVHFAPDVVFDSLREHLAADARGSATQWKRCCIIDALYHPGRYIRVAYALLPSGDVSSRRIWPEGHIVHLHHPVRKSVSRRGAVVRMNGVSAELYEFPNDRRLRGIRKIAGRREALALWQHWLDRAGDGITLEPDSLRRRLIRYVPEQKWIAKMRAKATRPNGGEPSVKSIALRGTTPQVCTTLTRRHRQLGHGLEGRGGFVVPAVVGTVEDQGILAVKWMRGDPLIETLQSNPSAQVMRRVASALRLMHATDMPDLPQITTAGLCDRLTEAAQDLRAACPDQADLIDGVLKDVLARLRGAEQDVAASSSTIHNDFHWNQLHFKGDRIGLFDLERMACGDPWIDVANFITQLRMLEHRADTNVPPAAPRQWADEFLDAWLDINGNHSIPPHCVCYVVLSLFELARGMMRHLRPDWSTLARRCVQSAASHLQRGAHETLAAL